jgi:hypothetical protein
MRWGREAPKVDDETTLAQLLSVSVHSPSPARNSYSWWSMHGPKWMPEMESGIQPVYNIAHVGPNRSNRSILSKR